MARLACTSMYWWKTTFVTCVLAIQQEGVSVILPAFIGADSGPIALAYSCRACHVGCIANSSYHACCCRCVLNVCTDLCAGGQACLPVKDLDLGYNLVRTHDGKGAFVIVDHDELDPVTSRAPMSTVYASGISLSMLQHGWGLCHHLLVVQMGSWQSLAPSSIHAHEWLFWCYSFRLLHACSAGLQLQQFCCHPRDRWHLKRLDQGRTQLALAAV